MKKTIRTCGVRIKSRQERNAELRDAAFAIVAGVENYSPASRNRRAAEIEEAFTAIGTVGGKGAATSARTAADGHTGATEKISSAKSTVKSVAKPAVKAAVKAAVKTVAKSSVKTSKTSAMKTTSTKTAAKATAKTAAAKTSAKTTAGMKSAAKPSARAKGPTPAGMSVGPHDGDAC